jgi:hypothetical protein
MPLAAPLRRVSRAAAHGPAGHAAPADRPVGRRSGPRTTGPPVGVLVLHRHEGFEPNASNGCKGADTSRSGRRAETMYGRRVTVRQRFTSAGQISPAAAQARPRWCRPLADRWPGTGRGPTGAQLPKLGEDAAVQSGPPGTGSVMAKLTNIRKTGTKPGIACLPRLTQSHGPSAACPSRLDQVSASAAHSSQLSKDRAPSRFRPPVPRGAGRA